MHVALRRAGGVSAGCYFKSCQSPVIAPVFQRPEAGRRQVRAKANTAELSRSRGNVVPLNEKTTNYEHVREGGMEWDVYRPRAAPRPLIR